MRVTELTIYPIKSLGGIAVESAHVETRGLKHDRRWMLIDQQGKFVSQREYPKLALTTVAFSGDGLLVNAPGMSPLLVPFNLMSSVPTPVRVWNDRCEGRKVDDSADSWFSDYLANPVSLVVMPEFSRRPAKRAVHPDDELSFADGYPILLIGQSSLDDLNSRLETPILMNRFRPNIVVSEAEPYEEDGWVEFTIGTELLHGVSNCSRCVMTTIEQETATRNTEPLHTLAKYRLRGQKIIFGRNLIPGSTGWIHVGDEVLIARRTTA